METRRDLKRAPAVAAFESVAGLIADLAEVVKDLAEQLEPARGGVNAQALENICARATLLAHGLRRVSKGQP